jgi:hypothetical protein
MGQPKTVLCKRFLTFVLNIDADPADSECVRLVKRIWYGATVVSLPVSLLFADTELMAGRPAGSAGFFFSFLLFLAVLVDGASRPVRFGRDRGPGRLGLPSGDVPVRRL